ncbi:MAG: MalY/PatB family protein [Phycisphaerae bacterium]
MQRSDLELDIPTLRHPDNFKWTKYPADVLPLWVADMDFAIAPSIRAALQSRLTQTLGYNHVEGDPELLRLLREKLERVGGGAWQNLPNRNWVRFLPGVVPCIGTAILGLTNPGDPVITLTPAYPPFLLAITDHHRELREAPMTPPTSHAGLWQINWDSLEHAALGQNNTPAKLLLLCHPHNPTGRLFTPDELSQLADFANRHHLHVVSDELHADLTLEGTHTPFAMVADEHLRQRTLTLTGPCKTYNTAGLGIGAMLSHDAPLLSRVVKAAAWVAGHPTAMAVAMWKAALSDDGHWLAAVLDYLRDNRTFLENFVHTHLPGVTIPHVQATYLAFLDYRAHPHVADIFNYLLKEAKVALNNGPDFGTNYQGFVRLNFATSRPILTEALTRLARAHNKSGADAPVG